MTFRTIAALTAALFVSGASAQSSCTSRDKLVKEAEKWKQQSVLVGFEQDGELMELLVSAKKTYTVILVDPRSDCARVEASGSDLMLTGELPPLGEPM